MAVFISKAILSLFFIKFHDGEDAVVTKVQQCVADALINLGLCALGQVEQAMVFMADLSYGGDKAKTAELLPCSGEAVAVVVSYMVQTICLNCSLSVM